MRTLELAAVSKTMIPAHDYLSARVGRRVRLQALLGVTTLTVFASSISIFQLSAQPIINPAQAWGPINNGICMAISVVRTSNASWHDVEFDLALRNVGCKDVHLNLGLMLGNGKEQQPVALQITLKDTKGVARDFSYSLAAGVIGGRIDDFLVALPAGATYVMRFNLERFCCRTQQVKLGVGHYRLAARFEGKGARSLNLDTPGIARLSFWKGIVRSNSVEFEVSP